MSGQEISEAIKALSESIGIASSEIIPHYVSWYIYSSIAWLFFAICLFGASVVVFKMFQKQAKKDDYDEDVWIFWSWALVIVAFIVSTIIFFAQIGDLLAPTGISIHQLISDIRG